MANEFGGIGKVTEEESVLGKDLNATGSFKRSFEGTQAEWSSLEQNKILHEIFNENSSDEKLEAAGVDKMEALAFLRSTDEDKSKMSHRELKMYESLQKAGVDPVEIIQRQKKIIKDKGELGEERVGFWSALAGGAAGFLADPKNAIITAFAGSAAIGTSAALGVTSIPGIAAIGALENGIGDAIIAGSLRTDDKRKLQGIAMGMAGGAILPGVGTAVGMGLKSARKTFSEVFNSSKLTKEVMAKAEKAIADAPNSSAKSAAKAEIEAYKEIGGNIKDAIEIRGKIVHDLHNGGTKNGKIVDGLKVDLPGDISVKGRNRSELLTNLKAELSKNKNVSPDAIDATINRLNSQEFVGNVDKFTVLTEGASRKKIPFTRSSGREVIIDSKFKHLVYETKELAEAAISKKKLEDVQIVSQRNGKFAVVREFDEARRLDGTKRFETKAQAEKELPEYAARMGLDPEDMSISTVPSRSKRADIKEDYIISHLGSVSRSKDLQRTTNTPLDNLSITKTRELVDDTTELKSNIDRMVEKKLPDTKDIDTTIDQLLLDDTIEFEMTKDLKRFNGMYKASKEVLEEIRKGCNI